MDSWRFIMGAVIHALIIACAIVYAGERISAANGSTHAESVGVKVAAAPAHQAAPAFLEDAALMEKVRAPGPSDHVYGNRESTIKLISYFDVNCGFCRRFYSVAKKAVDESGEAVSWNLRHYPLGIPSPSAQWARVPECIAEQKGSMGLFAFFDKAYLEEAPLNELFVSELTASLGVDREQYQSCLDSTEIFSRIERDRNEGQSLGVQGTPTTVVYNTANGKAILKMGAMPIDQLQSLIEQVR